MREDNFHTIAFIDEAPRHTRTKIDGVFSIRVANIVVVGSPAQLHLFLIVER